MSVIKSHKHFPLNSVFGSIFFFPASYKRIDKSNIDPIIMDGWTEVVIEPHVVQNLF